MFKLSIFVHNYATFISGHINLAEQNLCQYFGHLRATDT